MFSSKSIDATPVWMRDAAVSRDKHGRPRSSSLAGSLAQQIIDSIVNGQYAVAERLPSEADLAEIGGMSRLTVREAIKTLQERGVVTVRRGIGTFVNHPDRWSPLHMNVLVARAALLGDNNYAQISTDLLEARSFIEIGVAGLAAERRTDEELGMMKSALASMRDRFDEIEIFVESDIDFHDALMSAAGNSILAATYQPIHDLFYATRMETAKSSANRLIAIKSHEDILAAVEVRDQERAKSAMALHLDEAKSMF